MMVKTMSFGESQIHTTRIDTDCPSPGIDSIYLLDDTVCHNLRYKFWLSKPRSMLQMIWY